MSEIAVAPLGLDLTEDEQARNVTDHAEVNWNGASPTDAQVQRTREVVKAELLEREKNVKTRANQAIEKLIASWQEEFARTHDGKLQTMMQTARIAQQIVASA